MEYLRNSKTGVPMGWDEDFKIPIMNILDSKTAFQTLLINGIPGDSQFFLRQSFGRPPDWLRACSGIPLTLLLLISGNAPAGSGKCRRWVSDGQALVYPLFGSKGQELFHLTCHLSFSLLSKTPFRANGAHFGAKHDETSA